MTILRKGGNYWIDGKPLQKGRYAVFLDGAELKGCCAGASEEEGYADVFKLKPHLGNLPHYVLVNGKPVIERRFGVVRIVDKYAVDRASQELDSAIDALLEGTTPGEAVLTVP